MYRYSGSKMSTHSFTSHETLHHQEHLWGHDRTRQSLRRMCTLVHPLELQNDKCQYRIHVCSCCVALELKETITMELESQFLLLGASAL
jgi:hypothetical protein